MCSFLVYRVTNQNTRRGNALDRPKSKSRSMIVSASYRRDQSKTPRAELSSPIKPRRVRCSAQSDTEKEHHTVEPNIGSKKNRNNQNSMFEEKWGGRGAAGETTAVSRKKKRAKNTNARKITQTQFPFFIMSLLSGGTINISTTFCLARKTSPKTAKTSIKLSVLGLSRSSFSTSCA